MTGGQRFELTHCLSKNSAGLADVAVHPRTSVVQGALAGLALGLCAFGSGKPVLRGIESAAAAMHILPRLLFMGLRLTNLILHLFQLRHLRVQRRAGSGKLGVNVVEPVALGQPPRRS